MLYHYSKDADGIYLTWPEVPATGLPTNLFEFGDGSIEIAWKL